MDKDKIKEMLDTNKEKLWIFVDWYCKTANKDRTEENWDKNKGSLKEKYTTVMEKWLIREDVQNCIKEYIKQQRKMKMLEIYESMYQKALKGDVKSADWVANFFKSDFFQDATDEINLALDGIEIEGLK